MASRQHLIANEKAAGRLQDLADVEWLEQHPGDDSQPPCRLSRIRQLPRP